MRVGWISDPISDYLGGAELVERDLLDTCPMDAEIIRYQSELEPLPNVDVFVIHNVTTFTSRLAERLSRKSTPIIKQVHDLWFHGNVVLRSFLLESATVVLFGSQLHRKAFTHEVKAPFVVRPPAVNGARYAEPSTHRDKPRADAVAWVGRLFFGKGIQQALRWADSNEKDIHFYGWGPEARSIPTSRYYGPLVPDEVPQVLQEYSEFVFLPTMKEPFGRSVVEAKFSRCNLILNSNVGAAEWLEPWSQITNSCQNFWTLTQGIARKAIV
jgi:glycosyltransferase involved in cell wall biosynthesis